MAAANPSASGAKETEVTTSAATAAAAVLAELVLMEVSATDTNRSVHVETGSALPWEDADTGGTVDGETEVLSGGRERQVAGGRVEATTGGEGPELHKLELYQQQQYIQEEQEQEIVQVYQHYCASTSALRLQQPPKHIMAPRHHFVCIFRFFDFVDSNNPRFRRNFSLTPISYDYFKKKEINGHINIR